MTASLKTLKIAAYKYPFNFLNYLAQPIFDHKKINMSDTRK